MEEEGIGGEGSVEGKESTVSKGRGVVSSSEGKLRHRLSSGD